MRVLQILLLRLPILLVCCGCSTSSPDLFITSFAPEGWINSYTYDQPLDLYLRKEARAASAEGKHPIAYVYDDRNWECRRFRRYADDEEFSELLSDKRVIMLSHKYLHRRAANNRSPIEHTLDREAAFIPLDTNGVPAGPVVQGFASYGRNQSQQLKYLEYALGQIYAP